LKAPRKRQDLNQTNRAKAEKHKGSTKDRQASINIFLEEVKPAEKKQTMKRAAFFPIIQNQWGNGVKEAPRK
jgi:hypothetical protein